MEKNNNFNLVNFDYIKLKSIVYSKNSQNKLKELVKNINKKIDELENKRDYLNSITEIEIEFNKVTSELLGL